MTKSCYEPLAKVVGKKLITADLNAETGELTLIFEGHKYISVLLDSPDGEGDLLVVSENKMLNCWLPLDVDKPLLPEQVWWIFQNGRSLLDQDGVVLVFGSMVEIVDWEHAALFHRSEKEVTPPIPDYLGSTIPKPTPAHKRNPNEYINAFKEQK
jgi:hypothetical protein